MKAGSAGSIPDGVTTPPTISQPLSILLREIGEAVANLNTLVVGLDAVEKGHEKPDALDISWNPTDRQSAARKSRKFVLDSVIIRASESIFQYTSAISKLPRLSSVKSKWDSDTSKAEKVIDVFKHLLGEVFLVYGSAMIIHWRNRIVHGGSKAKLDPTGKRILQLNEDKIADAYKGLSVDCLLCHFEEGRPTLKDVSSLISMAINAARQIDNAIKVDLGKEDLDAWIVHYGINEKIDKVMHDTAPDKRNASIRRLFMTHAPLLLESYLIHYSASPTEK